MDIKISRNEANINKNRDQAITRDQGKNEEEGRSGKEARQTERKQGKFPFLGNPVPRGKGKGNRKGEAFPPLSGNWNGNVNSRSRSRVWTPLV